MKGYLKKGLALLLVGIMLVASLVSCQSKDTKDESSQGNTEKKELILGASPGPYDDLFRDAIKPILEKKGYTFKEIEFSDFKLCNVALQEGNVDFNVSQHTAYMNNFNEAQKADLVDLIKIPTVPTGIFSEKYKSVDEIKDGAKVGMPQDPANGARAFAVMQKAGWIKLKEGTDLSKVTAEDIEENKYNIEFIEMDSGQIPRSLADIDFGIIPGSVVYNAKIEAEKSLLSEDVLDHLVLALVVNGKNKDTKWANDIKDAYSSDEFKKYMEENNKDNYWVIPEQ